MVASTELLILLSAGGIPPADNKINSSVEATNAVLIDAINVAIKEEITIMKKYNLA